MKFENLYNHLERPQNKISSGANQHGVNAIEMAKMAEGWLLVK